MPKIDALTSQELLQLINSTKYGSVCNIKKINTLKGTNEIQFIDKRKINLLKFLHSLLDKKHSKVIKPSPKMDSYEKYKEDARLRNAERSASGRDIGAIPDPVNPQRKEECRYDLRKFLLTYFKEQAFYYELSEAMEEAILDLQKIILNGGLKALAMPRGSGKTTLLEIATQWAILYAHRLYVVFIGATVKDGFKSLDSIKTSIETNELIGEDFPEVVFPIKCLEGINIRTNGQMCLGERTHISWGADELILPTIKGSPTSGIILEATGMEGRIRGRKHTNQSGTNIRPDLFTCDDFQTDESAVNQDQCKKRLGIINKAIMGLAGAGKAIAGFIPCTVIQLGDAADQLLDREKYPQFQGSKTKMMLSFPTDTKLWEEYNEVREMGFNSGLGVAPSNKFYIENREALDEGCKVYWNDRYNRSTKDANGKVVEGEISAIQSAMNLYFKDEESFFSEYQNEPKSLVISLDIMKPKDLMQKINRVPQRIIPVGCSKLFTFIDIQKKALFFTTVAFEDNFTSGVVDYGTYPDQKKPYYILKDIKETIEKNHPNMGFEDGLFAALTDLVDALAGREYSIQGGGILKHTKIVIDANWGFSTDTVYEFCRKSKHSNILIPSHGMFIGASTTPFSEYKKKKGEQIGDHLRIPLVKGKRAIKHLLYDTNYWKSFTHSRINTGMGGNGHLSLFGEVEKRHELFADHICKSEFVIETEGRGRKVTEWKAQLSFQENHFFDGLVGCHVVASLLGVTLGQTFFKNSKIPKIPVSLTAIQAGKRGQSQVNPTENSQKPQESTKKPLSLAEIQKKRLNPDPIKR